MTHQGKKKPQRYRGKKPARSQKETGAKRDAEAKDEVIATLPDPPAIEGEEDAPFPVDQIGGGGSSGKPIDEGLGQTDDLDKEIVRFRYHTGRTVLYIAMAAMGVAVATDLIASSFPSVHSDLVSSAFEAFKLITMTVLGYIFGSSGSKSG